MRQVNLFALKKGELFSFLFPQLCWIIIDNKDEYILSYKTIWYMYTLQNIHNLTGESLICPYNVYTQLCCWAA